jgi:hypothetical protein
MWRWRAFKQDDDKFKEIPLDEYPKSIAILNIWLPGDPSRYSTGMEGERVDGLVLARECDPDQRYFSNTDQARLWFMLEVANDWEKACLQYKTSSGFVRQFKSKHRPVRLTSMELLPVPKEQRGF